MKFVSLLCCAAVFLLFFAPEVQGLDQAKTKNLQKCSENIEPENKTPKNSTMPFDAITIFLCGDVMTGRGIDQILAHPGDPVIYESYLKDARGYVKIAEAVNGPIDYPVGFAYVWGDALEELDRAAPDVRIVNLETSVTKSSDYWKGKGINYRMHPENIPILAVAKIDVCSLANNHTLDWGYAGLSETLASLKNANIKTAGAGKDLSEARIPAVLEVPGKGRVIVFAFGSGTSGVPSRWGASGKKPGVNLLSDLSDKSLFNIQEQIRRVKRQGDIVVASIHWGSNWGYSIPRNRRVFAHRLIDEAGVDVIHGHSSHHVRPIEVYKDKLILYGCGDFINDYEGIKGYEEFRADLSLMYFATLEPSTGRLLELHMTPTRIKKFKISRASTADTLWLKATINREGKAFGTRTMVSGDNRLMLQWD